MNSSRTRNVNATGRWTKALRNSWTVAGAMVTVLVGPAAATASALDRANAAPPYHAHETHPPYATPYATLPQPLKRSHNLG
ncbi:hypothetical protein OG762_11940 [Streptomyces sp. NBC_01136]|uniref:hypothetical protein n=1 Tax=unclassified Streptomyces TaxID=2593676 RepID=UPI0032502449|nr:hypothetical protein OG762_11940 [Streptomyces sp. NBC_01136]